MNEMNPLDQFNNPCKITWCSGCGNFAIFQALKNAFEKLLLKPEDILVVYGIGCHGHMVNYLKTYGFEGLHGRALPLATGAKIANKDLIVIAVVGDGDQLGEGGNHLIHAARRNIDITCILHNNQLYALTVGQASPTSDKGMKTRTTPEGVFEEPLFPLPLAISAGATFVARSFSGDINHLTEMIITGIKHRGFSFIDVLQPCVTLNYLNTYSWFYQRVYKLDHKNHLVGDKIEALKKSFEFGEKIPLGIFYQETRPTFEDNLPQLKKKILVKESIEGIKIDHLLSEFA